MTKKIIFALLFALAMLSACNSKSELAEIEEQNAQAENAPIKSASLSEAPAPTPAPIPSSSFAAAEAPSNKPADENTLTIAIRGNSYPYLESVIEIFKAEHEGIEVNVERIDFETYDSKIKTAILSGMAADIIHIPFDVDYEFAGSAYLADLNVFIDKDSEFNKSDYFESVFNCLEIGGKLPYIAGSFDMYFAGVNASSKEAVSLFSEYETVSFDDMIDIYNAVSDKKELDLSTQFSATEVVYSPEFVDFRNKICRYNEQEFVDKLYEAMELGQANPVSATNYIPEYAESHLFYNIGYMSRNVFMPAKEPYLSFSKWDINIDGSENLYVPTDFVDFKPFADANGNAFYYSVSSPTIAINANSTKQELAWKFIKLLISDEILDILLDNRNFKMSNQHQIFINKNVNRTFAENYYSTYIKKELGIDELPADVIADINATLDKIEGFANMPMVHTRNCPTNLNIEINKTVDMLNRGMITPEQAAAQLYSIVSIAFAE